MQQNRHISLIYKLMLATALLLSFDSLAFDNSNKTKLKNTVTDVKDATSSMRGVTVSSEKIFFEAHILRNTAAARYLLHNEKFLKEMPEFEALRKKLPDVIRLMTEHDTNKINNETFAKILADDFGVPFEKMSEKRKANAIEAVRKLNVADKAHMQNMYKKLKLNKKEVRLFEVLEEIVDKQDRYFTSLLGENYDYGRKMNSAYDFLTQGAGWRGAEKRIDPLKLKVAQFIEAKDAQGRYINYPYNSIVKGLSFEEYAHRKIYNTKPFGFFKMEQVGLAHTSPVKYTLMEKWRLKLSKKEAKLKLPQHENQSKNLSVLKKAGKLVLKALPFVSGAGTAVSALDSRTPDESLINVGLVSELADGELSSYYSQNIDKLFQLPINEQTVWRKHQALDWQAHLYAPTITGLKCEHNQMLVSASFDKNSPFGTTPTEFEFHREKGKNTEILHKSPNPSFNFQLELDKDGLPLYATYNKEQNGTLKPQKLYAPKIHEIKSTKNFFVFEDENKKRIKAIAQMIKMVSTYGDKLEQCCSDSRAYCPQELNKAGQEYTNGNLSSHHSVTYSPANKKNKVD